MSGPRIGSLASGYGGLDLGVQAVIGGRVVWHLEYDPAPSKILAHHWPDIPNHGDITTTDWTQVEPIDVLIGGYPCQPFSHAGKRRGTDDPRHIWPWIADAIRVLRPRLCVFENVAGHLGLGFDAVLADLAALGMDVRWGVVRASDTGAPHQRARLWIVVTDATVDGLAQWGVPQRDERPPAVRADPGAGPGVTRATDQGCAHCGGIAKVHADSGLCPDCQSPTLLPMPATVNGKSGRAMTASTDNGRRSGGGQSSPLGLEETASLLAGDVPDSDHLPLGNLPPASQAVVDALLLPTPTAQRTLTGGTDPGNWQDVLNLLPTPTSQAAKHGGTPDVNANGYGSNLWDLLPHLEFGPYAPAIARWEAVLGRPAPSPTEPGRDGRPRLSPLFVEWMMGLPAGHVTDPAIGLTRAQQLKALGNGVCPAQARLAVSLLTGMGAAPTLPTLPTLPTPTVSDGNGAGAHGGGGNDLRTTVALLPTPAVNDMGAGKTPADWDAWTARMKGAHGNGNGHGKSLAIEALRLGEPM